MTRFLRKLKEKFRNLRLLTIVTITLMIATILPWPWYLNALAEAKFIGIPAPYFFSIFVVPVFLLIILVVHANLVEDVDRHTLEFENE